jgi:hypothetical protein
VKVRLVGNTVTVESEEVMATVTVDVGAEFRYTK